MLVDRTHVSWRIEKITFREHISILREVAAVDAQFFGQGRGYSSAWMSERAHVITLGVRRACAMIADEVRTIAAEDAPEFAAEAGAWIGRLSARFVSLHRQRLMSGRGPATPAEVEEACNHLADVLLRECKNVIDEQLTYRPVASTNPGTLLMPDISTARLVVVGGRDTVRQSPLIDVGALLTILYEVRSSIGPLRMDPARRRALFKQIEALEDFAQRPKPHQGMLLGMVTRLAPMLKMARAIEATEIVEDFLKRRTGVR
jgi:hypothetical protein